MRASRSSIFWKMQKKGLYCKNISICVKVVMVINLLFCWCDLKDGASVLCLGGNFRLFVVKERIYLYTCTCTRYMFAHRLLLHLKHPFCIPNFWDSASSWKKFKQRQLVTQCSGGSDLAARRCVGVITAAINTAETCEELAAVAGCTQGQEGQAGAISCSICLSESGWAGGIWNVLLRGAALQLEAAQDPLGAYPGFPRRSHRQRTAATMQFWRWAVARAGINFSACKHTRIFLS